MADLIDRQAALAKSFDIGAFSNVVSAYDIAMIPAIDPESLCPKWISVEDGLPEEWADVLVLLQCGDCVVAARSGKHWRERWLNSMLDRSPTHWMPLPEPPKADTRGE